MTTPQKVLVFGVVCLVVAVAGGITGSDWMLGLGTLGFLGSIFGAAFVNGARR